MSHEFRYTNHAARGDCHATVPKPELAECVLTLHSQDPEPQRFQSGQILRGAARRNPPTPISTVFSSMVFHGLHRLSSWSHRAPRSEDKIEWRVIIMPTTSRAVGNSTRVALLLSVLDSG